MVNGSAGTDPPSIASIAHAEQGEPAMAAAAAAGGVADGIPPGLTQLVEIATTGAGMGRGRQSRLCMVPESRYDLGRTAESARL